jgi:hypothetical protein
MYYNVLAQSLRIMFAYTILLKRNQHEALSHGENIKVWSKKILTTYKMIRKSLKI